jgi:hypothetical protein
LSFDILNVTITHNYYRKNYMRRSPEFNQGQPSDKDPKNKKSSSGMTGSLKKLGRMAVLGAALMGSAPDAEAKRPRHNDLDTATTEHVAAEALDYNDEFAPEYRYPNVTHPENKNDQAPSGYHVEKVPDGIVFVEDLPEGYHIEQTPRGGLFVQNAPDGYKAVPSPEGMKYFKIKPLESDSNPTQ